MEKVNSEYVNCELCGQDHTKLLFRGRDRLSESEDLFNIVSCKNCGLAYTNPRPTETKIFSYYPPEYGPHQEMTWKEIGLNIGIMNEGQDYFSKLKNRIKGLILKEYYGYDSEKIFQIAICGKQLPCWLKKFLLFPFFLYFKGIYYKIPKCQKEGKILDFGCGNCSYLLFLQKMSWEAYGIDIKAPTSSLVQENPKIHIYIGDLHKQDLPYKFFDLITMWHSLEHTHHPQAILKESFRVLKNNGMIFICVPNISNLIAKIFKKRWLGLDLPRHLYHFSPNVLKKMLKKAGFHRVSIRHLPFRSGIPESLRYFLEDRKKRTKIVYWRIFKRLFFWASQICAMLHSGEIIMVHAVKPDIE